MMPAQSAITPKCPVPSEAAERHLTECDIIAPPRKRPEWHAARGEECPLIWCAGGATENVRQAIELYMANTVVIGGYRIMAFAFAFGF